MKNKFSKLVSGWSPGCNSGWAQDSWFAWFDELPLGIFWGIVCRLVCRLTFSFLWMPHNFIFCFGAAFFYSAAFFSELRAKILKSTSFVLSTISHHSAGSLNVTLTDLPAFSQCRYHIFYILHTAFFRTSISCFPNYKKVQQKRG